MNKNSYKILYVDDDAANRVLVRKILKSEGYDVVEAEDGISGIDMAKEEHPNLILMDMNMPGLDGYEASTLLKALPEFKNVPIIAITANALPGDKERSLIAGCEGYITKPIDPDTICSEIATYLDGMTELVKSDERDDYLQEYNNKLVERLEGKVRALSIALEKSEQANKAKTNFLAIISHELRTPLHAIINMPEIFKKKFSENMVDKQHEILDHITENGQELLKIINQIILYTELESADIKLSFTLCIMHDLIHETHTRFQPLAEGKGLVLVQQCSPDLPFVNVDVSQIREVLSALVDNSLKFTTEGEILLNCQLINADDTSIPQGISNSLDTKNNYIKVCVSDTGVGIPEENLERIFDNFSQSEDAHTRSQGGIGMGLTISRRLIEIHNGYIWASNNKEQGANFCFIIPAEPEN